MPAKKTTTRRRKISPQPEYQQPQYMPQAPSGGPSNILIILLIVLAFFAGYLFFKVKNLEQTPNTVNNNNPNNQAALPTRPAELKIAKPSVKDDHWRGSTNARYVWVEYSDFECPFCKTVHPSMLKLADAYKDQIAWVYRQFPLSFHQNAEKEAEASECMAEQGGNDAFWNFADKIFERTTSNGTGFALDQLGPLAAEIGLNQTQFQQCLDSGKYTNKVKSSLSDASQAGIQATPTGVIYDMKTGKTLLVEGALPYDSLKQQLDTFIAQNK